jgi:hypothetical protein
LRYPQYIQLVVRFLAHSRARNAIEPDENFDAARTRTPVPKSMETPQCKSPGLVGRKAAAVRFSRRLARGLLLYANNLLFRAAPAVARRTDRKRIRRQLI